MDVKKIAALAALSLSSEEETRLARQMDQILSFAALLPMGEEADAAAESATDAQSLRTDRVGESLPRETLLAAAETKRDGCFTVPRIGRKEGDE